MTWWSSVVGGLGEEAGFYKKVHSREMSIRVFS